MAYSATQVTSSAAFDQVLKKSTYVAALFYNGNELDGDLRHFTSSLGAFLSELPRDQVNIIKVDASSLKELAARYNFEARSKATVIIFHNGKQIRAEEVDSFEPPSAAPKAARSGGLEWRTADLPKGYSDITEQVDLKGLELLNSDSEFGSVRILVEAEKPSALSSNGKAIEDKKDWVESDTDEQLMLFMPFQAQLKIHTLQLTSLPPSSSEDDEERPMRPKTINLYTNTTHILGFEEAEGIPATQSITLAPSDWDSSGTANIPLRFVKFQNVTSLVLFVVDGDGDRERVRLDRLRIIGETGEKRDQGKLEKIEHDH